LSEITDRIAKGLKDVKKSVRAADELPRTRMTCGVFYRRSSAFIEGTHWIRPGKTTRCEKGLRENHKGTSPRRQARTA
jgi:hypothetical protein